MNTMKVIQTKKKMKMKVVPVFILAQEATKVIHLIVSNFIVVVVQKINIKKSIKVKEQEKNRNIFIMINIYQIIIMEMIWKEIKRRDVEVLIVQSKFIYPRMEKKKKIRGSFDVTPDDPRTSATDTKRTLFIPSLHTSSSNSTSTTVTSSSPSAPKLTKSMTTSPYKEVDGGVVRGTLNSSTASTPLLKGNS